MILNKGRKERKEGGGGEKSRKAGREGRRKGKRKGKGKEKRWNRTVQHELPIILGGKHSESCGNHSITQEMFFNKCSF